MFVEDWEGFLIGTEKTETDTEQQALMKATGECGIDKAELIGLRVYG